MSEYEITSLVMSEHDAFRRAFADLERAADLGAAWHQLADRLEVHAVAEEQLFYPVLAAESDNRVADGKAAVREHNDEHEHARGLSGDDADPQAVVDNNPT